MGKIESGGVLNGKDTYQAIWNIDENVYIKLTTASAKADHADGLYYSYLYFIFESQ